MTAGYSNTPQWKKIGLKAGHRVCIDSAPERWHLIEPPQDLIYVRTGDTADIILSFFRAERDLPTRLPQLGKAIFPDGMLWIAWPRKAAGHVSDMNENLIREHALPLGLVDVKVAALDNDWSGLKLVWRKELRPLINKGH